MKIIGLEGLSESEYNLQLSQGAKFVEFEYCISIIVWTLTFRSPIFFIKNGESVLNISAKYIVLTLLFGWWGFPFGPIFSIIALIKNLSGGINMTKMMTEKTGGLLIKTPQTEQSL